MQVKKEMSLVLVIVLAAMLLIGCSDITTITLNENGSGSYREVLTMSKNVWDASLGALGSDDAVKEYYRSSFPQAEIQIQDVDANGAESKELQLAMNFKDESEFQQLLSGMGMASVKFKPKYYSSTAIYMPIEDDTTGDDGLLPDQIDAMFGENAEAMAALTAELQTTNVQRTITFPYTVTETNGTLLEDGRTVIWNVDMSSLDLTAAQEQQRGYALFGEQDAKTAPVFNGAANGKNYNTGVMLNIDSANLLDKVTVNGETTESDALFLSAEGVYNITAVDKGGGSSKLKFRIDTTKPSVSGVTNGKTYKKACTIKFSDKGSGVKSAALNGKKISSGKKVTKKGSYTLVVTDKAGNKKTVKFKIKA